MPEPDREFQQRLLATFREEADEHSQAIARGLAEMESAATDEARASAVEQVLREAHSLKGAARAVGLRPIEASCQTLESLLSRVKRGETALDAAGLEAMRGHAQEILRFLAQSPGAESGTDQPRPGNPPAEKAPEETVRVSSSRLDRLMLQVEELIPARWAATHRSAEAQELRARMDQWRREYDKVQRATLAMQRPAGRGQTTVPGPGQAAGRGQSPGQGPTAGPGRGQSPATERADRSLTALLEFLRWSNEFSRGIEERLGQIARSMDREQRVLGAMVDSLRQETRLLLLRPFSSITEAFPRLVQDLSRQQGKEIALNVVGAGIEIDRRILQEMKDGLIHILRNSVDHGIETPQARREAKKATRGTITLSIERTNASRVAIVIEDDGGGIDMEKVRDAAVRSGLRTAQQIAAMGDAETVDLIFQSGLSTSPRVTDISGRGLGMAIVREKVERLGGDISVESRPGQGTSITLLLPLALSTLRGVIVRVATRLYIIPVTFIERVALVPPDNGAIRTIENRATVMIGDAAVSFVRLRDVLGVAPAGPQEQGPGGGQVVVVAAADRRVAFAVDEVIGEQELLLKSLGPLLVRVRNIGGAAALPTGELVPVLNAADLVKTAVKAAIPSTQDGYAGASPPSPRRILVVDDSITARTLLKSILETAGYVVRTAVDGAEALATVKEEPFDLVVSDVDMPRMNGFELTEKIRADRKLSDLPVVLVTALESRQDRERGIEAGANAYLVKSSFEQSNLLDIVRRYTEQEPP